MSNFTPGPWARTGLIVVSPTVKDTSMITPSYPDGGNTEVAAANGRTDEEAVANARLIAAAPEMYGLLNDMMTELASLINNYEISDEDATDAILICNKAHAIWRRIEGEEESEWTTD